MYGTWLINVFLASLGFILVFIGSITTNTWLTTLIRSILSFVTFFIIGYFIRWLIYFIIKDPNEGYDNEDSNPDNNSETDEHQNENENKTKQNTSNVNIENEPNADELIKKTSHYVKDLLEDD